MNVSKPTSSAVPLLVGILAFLLAATFHAWFNLIPKNIPSRLDKIYAPKSECGLIQVAGFGESTTYQGTDIIFVHGLNANPDTTWSVPAEPLEAQQSLLKPNSETPAQDRVRWIEDFLPNDLPVPLKEHLRVFYYNHDSYVAREARQTRLRHLGEELLQSALVDGWTNPLFRDIPLRTRAIIFLGTPHMGCHAARLRWILKALEPHGANAKLLDEITPENDVLVDLHKRFQDIFHDRMDVVNFYEQRPAIFRWGRYWWRHMTVRYDSATYVGNPNRVINRGLNGNHSQLNKFPKRNSDYKAVLAELVRLLRHFQRSTGFAPDLLVPTFVARPRLLEPANTAIEGCSIKANSICSIVFHGLGGAGKTQLARKAVEDWKHRYRAILWIDAHTRFTLEMSFIHFARLIGLEVTKDPDSDVFQDSPVVQSVLGWFQQSHTPSRPWLIVVDSAESLSRIELQAILPKVDNGHVIITSRDPMTCRFTTGNCVSIEVHSMEPVEASALLLRHMGIDHETSSAELRNASMDVCQRVGYLALAVEIAGAYIAEQEDPHPLSKLLQYSADFERHRDYLLKREPFSRLSSYNLTVWTVWDKSLSDIQSRYPSAHAAELLTILSALGSNFVHDDVFRLASAGLPKVQPKVLPPYERLPSWMEEWLSSTNSDWDSFRFREGTQLLARYSLINRLGEPNKGTKIHSLVQWRATQHQPSEPWNDWLILLILAAVYQTILDHNEAHLRQLLAPHISELNQRYGIFHCVKSRSTWSGWVFNTLGHFYQDEGQWCRAMQLHQKAFDIYSSLLGNSHLETLQVYSDMASSLYGQGRWLEAANMQQWIWEVYRKSFGSEDPITLAAMTRLAITYADLQELEKSEEMALYALQARNNSLGEHDQATLSSMNLVACVYLKRGRADEAQRLLVRTVSISKKVFGDLDGATATYEANLASAYSMSRRWAAAEQAYENTLEIQRKTLGEVHPLRLKTLSNLAYCYLEQLDLVKSEILFRDLVELRRTHQGYCHPETLDNMAALAYVLRLQGKKKEALSLMGECLAVARDKLSDHPYRMKFEAAMEEWQRSGWDVFKHAFVDFWDQANRHIRACLIAALRALSTPIGLLIKFFDHMA
ncbi:Tetratricopeptide repeat-containing protein [Cladophialophora immunda]|nr:Tetratricopeptide repeat-containing protein [Cladophialophora immunda]